MTTTPHIKKVKLKPGKEKPLLNRHHWIFSGAIAEMPNYENGEILQVYSASGVLLGSAYFNKKTSIAGRMVAFGADEPREAIAKSIRQAVQLRMNAIASNTNAYRVINAEGDFLPGLVVDRYGDVLVVQIATIGMERLKPFIVAELEKALKPVAIYEKSLMPSRKEEGMNPFEGVLSGTLPETIRMIENGYHFEVSPRKGQKTGFFLDQREMRALVGSLVKNKRVLNCFAYTGGFTVYALGGGASHVDSVDISAEALAEAKINCALNQLPENKSALIAADAFEFLREKKLDYDFVILDPPAFAKKAKDIIPACRGYKDINRLAIQKMPPQSFLLTCSCSYHVDEKLFQQVVFQAASEAKRNVRIVSRHRQAPDHPINLAHPEGDYLKSLLLYIE